MFENTASGFYKLHYKEAIAPYLTNDQKLQIARRVSELTLQSPIWTDSKTNHLPNFPELQPYVNTCLSGLYLCTIMAAIVDEYPKETKHG